ncbi:MAG: hypothetical protein AAB459_01885 [Patescibacteria group bacterium]
MKKLDQIGSHLAVVLVAILVLGVIGIAGWRVMSNDKKELVIGANNGGTDNKKDLSAESHGSVSWQWDGSKWTSLGAPPKCDEPISFKQTAVDTALVEGILYPGQVRGGNYKPHGGFWLKISSNAVQIKAIIDGTVVNGSRYIEMGETQYMFTIVNDCGLAYRFDHLLELSPTFKTLADQLPTAKENDSRTTNFNSGAKVKAGDVVATAVGFKQNANYTFDLGVYDYRQANEASKISGYKVKVGGDLNQAGYAICWLDLFAGANYSSLPASDHTAGKTSDYCR